MILKNKKFIISAAGDGIGFAISKLIVENGGKVYLTDIDQKKINKRLRIKYLINFIYIKVQKTFLKTSNIWNLVVKIY